MENSHSFFQNTECEYYPCHENIADINCLFCFCPLYNHAVCLGTPVYVENNGEKRKSCHACTFPHKRQNYEAIMDRLK